MKKILYRDTDSAVRGAVESHELERPGLPAAVRCHERHDRRDRAALIKTLNQYVVGQIPYTQIPTAYVTTFWWPWVKNYYGEGNVATPCGTIILRLCGLVRS